MESKWTWAFFAVFALLFFTFRVFINTAVTMLFLAEVARGARALARKCYAQCPKGINKSQ